MKFVVDLCKTQEYTDNNGVTWWSSKYRGIPNVLKLYQGLIGQCKEGVTVTNIFEWDGVIKAHVECDSPDAEGKFLCPKIYATLTEDKHIESVDYDSIELDDLPLSDKYATEDLVGLKPLRFVGEL